MSLSIAPVSRGVRLRRTPLLTGPCNILLHPALGTLRLAHLRATGWRDRRRLPQVLRRLRGEGLSPPRYLLFAHILLVGSDAPLVPEGVGHGAVAVAPEGVH